MKVLDVQRFMQQFERFNVFGSVSMDLRCSSINDIVPDETRDHLVQASERGRLLVSDFIKDSFLHRNVSLYSPS